MATGRPYNKTTTAAQKWVTKLHVAAYRATGGRIAAADGDPDWQPLLGPTLPTTKAQCKNGGYENFGFNNQGLCVAFVERGSKCSQ